MEISASLFTTCTKGTLILACVGMMNSVMPRSAFTQYLVLVQVGNDGELRALLMVSWDSDGSLVYQHKGCVHVLQQALGGTPGLLALGSS